MALPKSHRLSLRFERDRLTHSGKTVFGKYFTLVTADKPPATQNSYPCFAILLSKKTAPLAVNRNKIKRITSDIIENNLSSFSSKDYLVIPKRQVLTENFQSLQTDLLSLFDK